MPAALVEARDARGRRRRHAGRRARRGAGRLADRGSAGHIIAAAVAAAAHAGHGLEGLGGRGRSAGLRARDGCVGVVVRVLARCVEGGQDFGVVGDGDGVVGAGLVVVDVGLRTRRVGATGWVVAFHGHFLYHGVVVAVLHVWRVPVDQAAGPVHGTNVIGGETGGPE